MKFASTRRLPARLTLMNTFNPRLLLPLLGLVCWVGMGAPQAAVPEPQQTPQAVHARR